MKISNAATFHMINSIQHNPPMSEGSKIVELTLQHFL